MNNLIAIFFIKALKKMMLMIKINCSLFQIILMLDTKEKHLKHGKISMIHNQISTK